MWAKKLISFAKLHSDWFFLVSIITMGTFLRFYSLGGKSLYADEGEYWKRAVTLASGGHFDNVIDLNIDF